MSVISAQSKRSAIKSSVSTTQDDLLSVSSRQRQSKKDEVKTKKKGNSLIKVKVLFAYQILLYKIRLFEKK